MKYEMQDYDGTMIFQPKNLLTKKDEHDLLWKVLGVMTFVFTIALLNLEHWGVIDAVIEYLAK